MSNCESAESARHSIPKEPTSQWAYVRCNRRSRRDYHHNKWPQRPASSPRGRTGCRPRRLAERVANGARRIRSALGGSACRHGGPRHSGTGGHRSQRIDKWARSPIIVGQTSSQYTGCWYGRLGKQWWPGGDWCRGE